MGGLAGMGGGGLGGLAGIGGGIAGLGGAGLVGGGAAPPLGSLKTVEENVTLEFPVDGPTTHLTVTAVEKTTASLAGSVVFRGETVRRYERSAESPPE
jgi:hypothetical protein